MVVSPQSDVTSFKLARLRFQRLPPCRIVLTPTHRRFSTTQVQLSVGVTDDYGDILNAVTHVNVKLGVVNAISGQPIPGLHLTIDGKDDVKNHLNHGDLEEDSECAWRMTGAYGGFEDIKVNLRFPQNIIPTTGNALKIRFSLSSVSTSAENQHNRHSEDSAHILRHVGGVWKQMFHDELFEHWYFAIPAYTGSVAVDLDNISDARGQDHNPSQGKKHKGNDGTVLTRPARSGEKVQTVYRELYADTLLSFSDRMRSGGHGKSETALITVIERPGMNNSTGQRLWDCAIGFSSFLLRHPNILVSSAIPNEVFNHQKRTPTRHVLQVIELGAGCGLASLTAGIIARSQKPNWYTQIWATDVETTVRTTLRENIEQNPDTRIRTKVLDWGNLLPEDLNDFLTQERPEWDDADGINCSYDLTILGTDLLYNPDSHDVLLETLHWLLKPSPTVSDAWNRKALVAYKARTDGDDAFFVKASSSGLQVTKIWEWSEITVWELRMN